MSGEPSEDPTKPTGEPDAAAAATPSPNDSGGVIPVEVEAPEVTPPPAEASGEKPPVKFVEPTPPPPPDPTVELEKKIAALEKEKKDNWDKYLRTAADVENLRKRQKREVEDAKFETKNKVLKEMLPV